MKTIADLSEKVEQYALNYNSKILLSIAKHGLVPPNKLKGFGPGIFGINTNGVNSELCVNYVALYLILGDKIAIENAIKTILWEESTGVFGISIERTWDFNFFKEKDMLTDEIQQRVQNNIVFILRPPTTPIINANEVPTTVGSKKTIIPKICYTFDDSMSQAQGDVLLDKDRDYKSAQVMEIKTPKTFSCKDILAILVPENLFSQAQKFFKDTGISLFKVPVTKSKIGKIPKMMQYMFKTQLDASIDIVIPDYEQAIYQHILPKYPAFALHAVRLANKYDIAMRFVANPASVQSKQVLSKLTAEVCMTDNPSNGAWCLYHNSLSYAPITKDEMLIAIYQNHAFKPRVIPEISELKGAFAMTKTLTKEITNKNLVAGIYKLNISAASNSQILMFSIPPSLKNQKSLTKYICNEGKKCLAATTKIQNWWRARPTKLKP